MTEPIEPMTPEDSSGDVAEVDSDEPQTIEAARKLRSENRSLRTRLRTAESEREAIKTDLEAAVTRLAAAQHSDVERHAETHLLDRTDIWRAQPDMAAFLDEFGAVDQVKVAEAAQQLVAEKPHLARPPKSPPPTDRPLEGLRGGASPAVTPSTPSWQEFIRGHSGQHG